MRGKTAETVIAILAAQALIDPSDIRLDASMDSLGLDSLGLVEAIFAIEEAFDISVPFNPADPAESTGFDSATVAGLVAAVEELIAQKAG